MPLITINVNLSEKQLKQLRQNSFERVLNTATRILEENFAVLDHDEDASICIEDLNELKATASSLWYCAANSAIMHAAKDEPVEIADQLDNFHKHGFPE